MTGKNWVDIAFFGDSNTMYSNSGWTVGFGYDLWQNRRIKAYASNIFPGASTTASAHSSNFGPAENSALNIDCYVTRAYGQPGNVPPNPALYTWLTLGSTSGVAFANTLWPSGTGLRPASGFNDWTYVSSTADDQRMHDFNLRLYPNNALDSTSEFIYRAGYLTFASGGGGFRLSCTSPDHGTGSVVSTSTRINCQTGTDGYTIATATVAANPARANQNMYFKKYGFNEFANDNTYEVVGKCGFLFESVCVPNRPGYAINCISYASGDTIQQIAASCSTAISALKIYFKEMYDRQVLCGGPGRVIVFLNGGINDWNQFNAISAESHVKNTLDFVDNCKKAWSQLGLSSGLLSFMIMPSHQHLSTDALSDYRKFIKDAVRVSEDICVIDTPEMGATWSYLTSAGHYASGGADTFHLTEIGYRRVSETIILELLNYAKEPIMANTVASLNPLSTVTAFAPDFRGEAKNAWQTPVLAVNAAVTLPKIESYPAVFSITSEADSAANSRAGVICALSASKLIVLAGNKVASVAAAESIVPTISSGVITLTSHSSTFSNPGTAQPVNVVRLT